MVIHLVIGLVVGLLFGAYAIFAQAPPAVPDWVVRYAGILQQRVQKCEQDLAMAEDKSDKLAKDLASVRAAKTKEEK